MTVFFCFQLLNAVIVRIQGSNWEGYNIYVDSWLLESWNSKEGTGVDTPNNKLAISNMTEMLLYFSNF